MTPDTDNREWLGEWIYAKFVQNYEKLLEENKNLNKQIEQFKKWVKAWTKIIERLEEENKKLRAYADNLDSENDNQAIEIEKLKLHIEAKDKAYMSLLTDYNYLQARIKRMEKAFLEYVENHKKLEDELDDVIMNR